MNLRHSDVLAEGGRVDPVAHPVAAERWRRAGGFLALERNVALVAGAMFLMGLGENLWRRFIPKYLEALGAPVVAIGLYGSAQDLLDGLYQYPGGWVADRYGRRAALQLFITLAAAGYVVYLLAPSWPFLFLGLALVMAWSSMASPTLFAVVGDALPKGRRAMGFTVQAILRRMPIVIAPTLGGVAIALYGTRAGVRVGLAATLVLALLTLLLGSRVRLPLRDATPMGIAGVWRSIPHPLRWLLASDILTRTCEAMAGVFIVLYATDVVGVTAPEYGLLVAVEMATAIAVYLPAARLADRTGRKAFVVATFVAFSFFPLAVAASRSFGALLAAFVVGGLREIGEPARKALIVDLADPTLRARTVGLYYLARGVAITPAAVVGGLLWTRSPAAPFIVAAAIGLVGMIIFACTVDEAHAA
jgi:MFS family permease